MTLNLQGESLVRLLGAVVCGGALGLNRELHAKRAGVRTLGVVALGAALVTVIAVHITAPVDGAAVSRVIQGVVAGVGFLGAGVIVHGNGSGTGSKDVHGLTTAALTWLSAGLGIACGAGEWALAIGALALALVLLVVGGPVERSVKRELQPHGAAGVDVGIHAHEPDAEPAS